MFHVFIIKIKGMRNDKYAFQKGIPADYKEVVKS